MYSKYIEDLNNNIWELQLKIEDLQFDILYKHRDIVHCRCADHWETCECCEKREEDIGKYFKEIEELTVRIHELKKALYEWQIIQDIEEGGV